MTPNITIPKPCHENWSNMSQREQGRHCQVCCKTVVDFSSRSNEEIVDFLKTNSSQRVCGRFRKEQVVPHTTAKPVNRYRLFFAALIFVFGGALFSSCNPMHQEEVMGKVAIVDTVTPVNDTVTKHAQQPDTTTKSHIGKTSCPPKDTIDPREYMMGEIYMPIEDTLK